MDNDPVPQNDFDLVNAFESKVRQVVKGVIDKDPEMCKCEKCFLDVCALVLNGGFAHFVTTKKGELLAMLPNMSDNRDIDILVAALKSVELVKKNPNH